MTITAKTNEELYQFLNQCVKEGETLYKIQTCDLVMFEAIKFGKNFDSIIKFDIEIKRVKYLGRSGTDSGYFDISGWTKSENGEIFPFYYQYCLYCGGLFNINESDKSVVYFYDDINKQTTFEKIKELYKEYSINLVKEIRSLNKNYIELKYIING